VTAASQVRFRDLESRPLARIGGTNRGLRGTFRQLGEILAHRELLLLLVRRDLKSRYKDSVLGFLWTLVRPLTQLLIYYIALGKFLGAARGIPDFAVYIFTGLTVWSLFSEIIAGGTASVVGNSGLLKKIYLPREVFPIASVGAALFNFVMQMVVLLAATLVLEQFPFGTNLFYFLPALLVVVTFGTALALLLSALNVYLRDVQYLVEVILLIMFWASPIVYPWHTVSRVLGPSILLDVYTDNPVTLAVLGFQRAFWAGAGAASYPDDLFWRMWVAVLVGLVAIVGCQAVFARLQGNFAQAL